MGSVIFMTAFKSSLVPVFETLAWLLATAILPTLSLQTSGTTLENAGEGVVFLDFNDHALANMLVKGTDGRMI